MEQVSNLIIKSEDFLKLSALLNSAPIEIQDLLQTELDRATVIPDEEFPDGVVSMNSLVTYLDLSTNKKTTVTLVYPHDAKIDEGKISVLAPIGAALIGLKVGHTIKWPLPQGKEKEIQVVECRRAEPSEAKS